MSAERRAHSRTAGASPLKSLRSNSSCSTEPPTRSSSSAVTGRAAGSASAASATAVIVAAARGEGTARSARCLSKEHALCLFGHGFPGVDRRGSGVGAHGSRTLADAFEPALQVGELLEPLPLCLVGHDPWIAGDIGDRVLPRNVGAIIEAMIEYTVQAVGFLHVALDGIRNLLGSITREVMVLSRHGTETSHLPDEPLRHLEPTAQLCRAELAGRYSDVHEDRAGREH